MSRLERFRSNKNTFFKEHANSPLTPEQRERFTQLEYYPENESLRFEVKLDTEGVTPEPVVLGTTTGEPKEFIPAGRAHLDIEGQMVSVMVYREPGRGRYFLPFRDATAGTETYEVGRYLDPQAKPDGTLILDFNMAYNPYCAYNDNFTCPIPPFENIVQVPIRSGEKIYPDKV
jgi:uncharacterized protein